VDLINPSDTGDVSLQLTSNYIESLRAIQRVQPD